MSSAATSSLASTAPTRPGSRCVIGRMRLKRCVAWLAPAAIAACASSNDAPEWPSATRVPARTSVADQIEPAIQLGRERDDADVGTVALEQREDFGGAERIRRRRRRRAGHAQALRRLRAAVLLTDEVALEMRRQHARVSGRRRGTRSRDVLQKRREHRRRTGQRRRTERGDTPLRQATGHAARRRPARRARRYRRRRGRARR